MRSKASCASCRRPCGSESDTPIGVSPNGDELAGSLIGESFAWYLGFMFNWLVSVTVLLVLIHFKLWAGVGLCLCYMLAVSLTTENT